MRTSDAWRDPNEATVGDQPRPSGYRTLAEFRKGMRGSVNIEDLLGDLFARGQRSRTGRTRTQGRASPFFEDLGDFEEVQLGGADISAEMTVNLLDALRGTEREIEVSGTRLKVKIPKGVREGQKIRLKGQG